MFSIYICLNQHNHVKLSKVFIYTKVWLEDVNSEFYGEDEASSIQSCQNYLKTTELRQIASCVCIWGRVSVGFT